MFVSQQTITARFGFSIDAMLSLGGFKEYI